MEKYIAAAGTHRRPRHGRRSAARKAARSRVPARKDKNIRRVDRSTIEATHRVDFDGEYVIRVGLPGERADDAKPVKLGFWMDGKLLKTMPVETKPSELVYFDPYSEEQMRLYLPEGDHVFRAGFHRRRFRQDARRQRRLQQQEEQVPQTRSSFVGPFPSTVEKAEPQEDLDLRSEHPARRASRRSSPTWRIAPTAVR